MTHWSDEALEQLADLASRDVRLAQRIRRAVIAHRDRGEGDVKKLVGQSEWRLRVGDWGVLFERLPGGDLRIHAISNRRDAYE